MTTALTIIFWLSCVWLILMILSTVLITIITSIDYGKVWVIQYFDNWFTYLAFGFVGIRLVGSIFQKKGEIVK